MKRGTRHGVFPRSHEGGFSLVELMIALVLGLIVIGGVISVFLSIQRSYRTNEALSQIQNGARIAFSLMARDIREAGLTGCGNQDRVANVLKNGPNAGGTVDWWANFGNAIEGYGGGTVDPAVVIGTSTGQRVAGTDSVHVLGAEGLGLSASVCATCNSAEFKLNEGSSALEPGDIVVVCDPDHATIAQVTNINSNTVSLVHNTGNSVSPGNCSKGLGFPTACTTNGNTYTFGANSQLTKLSAVDWYIGNNPVGGRSLYRAMLSVGSGGVAQIQDVETVRGVTGMTILYHMAGTTSYVNAATVGANWSGVDSVQVTLTLQSQDQRAGTNAQPLTRMLTTTVTLRNRVNS